MFDTNNLLGSVSVEMPREKQGEKAAGKCIDMPKKFD